MSGFQCSSASRKFLNTNADTLEPANFEFQCSSASRKFLNSTTRAPARTWKSAFQCSSASRKFLNHLPRLFGLYVKEFQCSSASRKFLNQIAKSRRKSRKLFQCSSASRKFLNCCMTTSAAGACCVSVLFSEPKIPQFPRPVAPATAHRSFSALQRAENSSIPSLAPASIHISDRDDHASSFLSLPGASP